MNGAESLATTLLASGVEGVVMVIRVNGARTRAIRTALQRIAISGTPVFGALATMLDRRHAAYGYGYGCACINGNVAKSTWQFNRVTSVKPQPIKVCNDDPNIPHRAVSKKKVDLCGWLSNPTPANWSLFDRFGEWRFATQGGYQAPGSENLEHTKEWVHSNGNYGYGCACVNAEVDDVYKENLRAYKINGKVQSQPLSVCRNDQIGRAHV